MRSIGLKTASQAICAFGIVHATRARVHHIPRENYFALGACNTRLNRPYGAYGNRAGHQRSNRNMLYALITEYGLDQVCETRGDMLRERKDLRDMGCTVKVLTFADWASLESAQERGEFDV